ncbi:MAG: type II toxin-antitoxin system PemK/MazF family toxin [Nitrospirae bacterium]|nr:type II toxin-antitoxin system PemK/MazF family toxin [Nitrospirota bacterium]
MKKGDVYLANLDPAVGSEQSGTRPILVFQNVELTKFTRTIVIIPFTTNLKRSQLPACVFVPRGEGGLDNDCVAICYQIRVLDKSRLIRYLGTLSDKVLSEIEDALKFTLDTK